MENSMDNRNANTNHHIIPRLDKRWWDFVLKHSNIWARLPTDVSNLIRDYLMADDPNFIKQKHLPLIISKPGRYHLVEDIHFKNIIDKPLISVHNTNGVFIFGRNHAVVTKNTFIHINNSAVEISNAAIMSEVESPMRKVIVLSSTSAKQPKKLHKLYPSKAPNKYNRRPK